MKNIKKTIGFLCSAAFCAAAFIGTPQITKAAEVAINETNFPDENFRNYVTNNFDDDADGQLSDEELAAADYIGISKKDISSLKGVEYFPYLTELDCCNNQLSELDVSQNTTLENLHCYNNQLSQLKLNGHTYGNCHIYIYDYATSHLSDLQNMNDFDYGEVEVIDITKPATCKVDGRDLTIIYADVVTDSATTSPSTEPTSDATTTIKGNVSIDETNFPDKNFRNYVTKEFDEDSNGQLSDAEITAVDDIDVRSHGISNLKGLEYFSYLTDLNCGSNKLTTLDLSKNTALKYLNCEINQLTTLDLSKNTALTELDCHSNQLSTLDVSQSAALTRLHCYNNPLTQLKLNSHTYGNCELIIYDDLARLSDLQNMEEYDAEVIDITKPATCKLNGRDFTIIYADVITDSATTSPSTELTGDTPAAKNKVKKVKAVKKTVTLNKNKKTDAAFKITTTGNKKIKAADVKTVIKNNKIAKVVKVSVKSKKVVVTVKGLKKGKTTLKLDIDGKTASTTLKIK